MAAYYNEIDPAAAQWLRNLIEAGHIAPGYVDERSIEDVTPGDLARYTQCHFFAGIGVWSYALRRAGWPDDRSIWTGSCPCQPFSSAGAQAGFDDERHLWPHFQWLIEQCRPAIIFGEQVASKAVEPWVDLVQTDMEGLGYAFAGIPFPSAGVGAPHIRDRLFWVGHSDESRLEGLGRGYQTEGERVATVRPVAETSESSGLADSDDSGFQRAERKRQTGEKGAPGGYPAECGGADGASATGPTNGFWGTADWLFCRDGKWRPVEPGTFPLAHGAPARVVRLRAYGNAINAEAARQFIEAYLDTQTGG